MVVVTIISTLYLTGIIPRVEVSPMPSIPPMPEIPIEYSTEFHYFGYAFVLVGIISGIYIYVTHKSNTYGESIRSFFDIVLSNFFVQVYLFALISYVIYYIIEIKKIHTKKNNFIYQ
jgi:predicted membrane protein